MRKLRTFFHVLFKSATNPVYYRDILKTRFSFSLKYLAFLFFLLSLITTAKAVAAYRAAFPAVLKLQKQMEEGGETWYPKELVVTVRDGVVSTNVKEPYTIDFPFQFPGMDEGAIAHLITIDTKAQAADLSSYQSLIVVGKNAVYAQDSQGYKFYPLSGMKGEVIINKALYDEWIGKAAPYVGAIPTIARWGVVAFFLLVPFLVTAGTLVAKLSYLLVVSLIVLLLARLMKKPVGYGVVYRFGMHGLTVPLLASLVLAAFGVQVPLLFTLVFFVWMGVVLSRLSVAKSR